MRIKINECLPICWRISEIIMFVKDFALYSMSFIYSRVKFQSLIVNVKSNVTSLRYWLLWDYIIKYLAYFSKRIFAQWTRRSSAAMGGCPQICRAWSRSGETKCLSSSYGMLVAMVIMAIILFVCFWCVVGDYWSDLCCQCNSYFSSWWYNSTVFL